MASVEIEGGKYITGDLFYSWHLITMPLGTFKKYKNMPVFLETMFRIQDYYVGWLRLLKTDE